MMVLMEHRRNDFPIDLNFADVTALYLKQNPAPY